MADVCVVPMPAKIRQIPRRWWHYHPPLFSNGDATRDDILLALELLEALDDESKAWYRYDQLQPRLKARLEAM